MAITYYSSRGYNNSQNNSVLSNPSGISYLSSRGYDNTATQQNRGGLLGGIGYLGEKLAVGFVSSIEGITDYTFSGLAKLFGRDDWAEDLIANDWFGDWYSHPEEWFNPGEGWKVAGDVAGGIGTSLPGMAAAVLTGGVAAGAAASFVVSGLGAAGRATKEAYQQTGQLTGKEYGYGALVGATEGGVEALGNLLSLGSGAVVKSISKAIGKETAEAFTRQGIIKTLGASFAGEAFEEGLSEWLTPYWQKATYDPNAKNATADEILYSSLVGGLSGLVMGGGGYVIESGVNYSKGNKLTLSGQDSGVLDTSGFFSAYEDINQSGDELLSEISSRRKSLLESLQKTGGKAVTMQQKRELGALDRANVAASAKLFVAKRAENIVNNAEVIAQRLTAYGYKTADGKPITFTASEITEGYDASKPSSIYKALQINSKLRELAVADATGRLMMDTNQFMKSTLMGEKLASQVDINRFYEQASVEEIRAVSDALKIDSWSGLTPEILNQRIVDFVNDGGVDRTVQANERRAAFEALAQDATQGVPKYIGMGQDGMARYSDGQLDIGIERRGDSYRTYNYGTKQMSKDLTVGEVNSFLREYGAKRDEYAAAERERIESEQRRKNEIAEVDNFARENVKEYKTLSAPSQGMIRKVIREGRANGLSDSDVTMLARVSAHSGIDIQFDDSANFVRKTKSGKEITTSGFYEADKNCIVMNPNGKRTAERLLIHELDHAITKDSGKNRKKVLDMYKTAIKNTEAEKRNDIIEAYGDDLFTTLDETNAYYAEQVLGNKYTLEKLIEAEPTLKDKILSFFKGASTDYADVPKLSGAAKKYYRTYKKLFDEFSARNAQSNANETITSGKSDKQYAFAGVNAKTADKMKLATAEQMLKEGKDSETVRRETGWFKGYDGKWRFEIDDSELKVATNGKYSRNPMIKRYAELIEKVYFDFTASIEEQTELKELDQKLKDVSLEPEYLGDIIEHPQLFVAYPQLQGVKIAFIRGIDTNKASYHPGFNEIAISQSLRLQPEKLKNVLIHEIQHAIQEIEGLAGGSNVEMFNDTAEKTAFEQYYNTAGEIEARDAANRLKMSEEQRKNTRPDIDRTDVVFAESSSVSYFAKGEYDSETAGIRDQIKNAQEMLNRMPLVYKANVPYKVGSKENAGTWAISELKKYGFQVDRKDFGKIYFGEKAIRDAMNYLDTDAEKVSIVGIYKVLKQGIQIGEHTDHKQRGKHTITFAAPVELNGKRGNMAVVVNLRNNQYKVHRIVMPDGSVFKFDVTKNNAEQESQRGVPKGSLANATSSASKDSITENSENVKDFDKKSLENSSGKDFALDIDSEGENISGAEVMGWLNNKPEGDEFNSPTIATVGKERVTYQEKFGSKEWRKTKTESAYIHAVDEMYGIQSYLEKVGKVKNAKAIIQNVRSTPHQAQSMIGSVQYNVFEADRKSAKKMGEGLNEIFRPIEKMGDKAAIDFDDYLLNYLNVDKYQVIEKTQRHDKDAAESLSKVREKIGNLEDHRSELENRIFNLGNSPAEVRIKEGLKKSIEKIDNEINKSRSDEIALLSEAPGYAEAELKKLINETAELLGEKERAKAEIYTLGNDESQMKRKVELKERISNIEGKLKRLEESAAAMEEIAKAYKIAIKPVFNLDGATITKEESQRLIREYEKKYPEFKKIAQKVWNFNKNLNAMRVSAGLISKRIADRLAVMYPHYVPSFKAKINNNAQGEGGVSVASTVKKAKGYNSNIMSVKESMASQISQVIRNGNINMLANKVYDTAVKTGDSKYVDIKLPDGEGEDISTEGIERPKPHTLTFFKEGKEYKIDISEEIYQGFKGIGEQSAPDSNVFARVTNWISDKYKKLVTSYSPAFMIRNAIRDMQDAGLNSKHPLLFARNISRAWVELVNNSENWQTYRAYGGFSSTVFDSKGVSGDVGARGFEILGIKDRIESGDKLSVKDAKYLKSIFTGVENLNAVVEQIPRFAEYLASIEAGETIEQAIYNSAEVTTNFGRRGATTKQLNATIIPFLNPAVQGFDKIFRNVTDAAKAGDAKAVTKAFGTLLGKAIAIGILPMLFNSLMYDDDEDYKDLREEDKENNYLIKLPNGTFLKLPRGRVASVIGGLYNRTAKMAKGEDADWLGYLENVKSQVTPVENLTRTVFSPFMDVAMNRTWYGTEIEGMQFENVRPKDRYDESTSSIAIAIGQVFNYSPKKIHYLIDQYSGVIGDFLLPATSKKAEKDFFSGNFTIDAATSNKISTNFYKLYDEARYSKTDGDVKAQYQLKYLNKVKAAASEMYKEINAIQSSNISAYEKLQQVRVLRVMINEAYKNAIADYEKIGAAIDATANMGYNDADTGDANIRYAEIIKQVYGAERALSEYNGTVYSNMTVLNTAGLSYDKLYDYYFGTKNIESDVDAQGNTISGSKRKKVVSAISSLGVSVEQRLLLICASGYALKDGDVRGLSADAAKARLLKYILRISGLTADERLEIAEMCGFEVKNGRIINNFSKKLKKLSKK